MVRMSIGADHYGLAIQCERIGVQLHGGCDRRIGPAGAHSDEWKVYLLEELNQRCGKRMGKRLTVADERRLTKLGLACLQGDYGHSRSSGYGAVRCAISAKVARWSLVPRPWQSQCRVADVVPLASCANGIIPAI
jgi:hypothetical protein